LYGVQAKELYNNKEQKDPPGPAGAKEIL
jgi:hypothetical protein